MSTATIIIGDYQYSIRDYDIPYTEPYTRAEVVDKTKTAYAPVPESISYQGKSYNVDSLQNAYSGCVNLLSAPSIPNGVRSMERTFAGCVNMVSPPTSLPTSLRTITECFEGCVSMTSPPAIIPDVGDSFIYGKTYERLFLNCRSLKTAPTFQGTDVSSMYRCFEGCSALEEFPILPTFDSADLELCFSGCASLPASVSLPSGISDMTKCFNGCTSLQEVHVNSTPVGYTDIFANTENPIFIVNAGSASASTWQAIANQYSNVHYEADDNPAPTLAYSVTRVNANGDTSESTEGAWAYVRAVSKIYSTLLPTGWTCVLDPNETELTIDGTPITPTWQRSSVTKNGITTVTSQAWINLGDISKRTFTLQIADDAKNGVGTIKSSKVSQLLAFILPASFATIDFLAGGKGVAIGTFAQAEGLHVAFDVGFTSNAYIKLDPVKDASLIQAIRDLGWADDVLTSITLNRQTGAIQIGGTLSLIATVTPSDLQVTWSSLDESIATVSSAGVVAGIAAGTTVISAELNTGGVTEAATCTVTVS